MSGTYAKYKTSKIKEREGTPITILGVGTFFSRRMGGANTRFKQVVEKELKPYRRASSGIDADTVNAAKRKGFIETCLTGWVGSEEERTDPKWVVVTDENGDPLPYSIEAAEKLFDDLPDLYWDLVELAESPAVFKEADAGN